MQTIELTPAAAPIAAPPALDILEIAAVDGQRRRFGWVSLAAIGVSFVHMAAALILFSGAAWFERLAALGMTALVDVATWAVAEYLDYARRRRLARSPWIRLLFGFALAISMFLNGAYLWAHRPPAATLPGWLSGGVAIAFAVFVPLLIAIASLVRGELTDDRLRLQQGAEAERAASLRLAEAERALGDAQAAAAHWERQSAHWERDAAQRGAEGAQAARDAEELRAQLAQREGELRAALEAGPLSPLHVAQRLLALGESQRAAAAFVGMTESTLRGRLKAAAQGG